LKQTLFSPEQAACYDLAMTLEQLRVFVAVAERQHMTRAAEALNLAQSAVSSAIAGLEARRSQN
jgi:DNA-binding transcriptional LysR family regulator